jgi:hypothetical protein
VLPVRIDPAGLSGPTRGQAAGPRWRQTSRGFHVPADVEVTPAQRAAEQVPRLPAGGALTGWAALHLLGASYIDGVATDGRTLRPVPLALGRRGNIRGGPDVRLLREPLSPRDVVRVRGVPCATVERAAFDAMRLAPDLAEAVVVADMTAYDELSSRHRMRAYVDAHPGWRGIGQARHALDLSDENSWSPNETRTRKLWVVDAGLPPPLVNVPIFDRSGRLLGYPDLLDEEAGLVGEFDGAEHRRAARHSSDVGREDAFRRHLLEVARVTGPDLLVPDRVVRRLLAARSRARWLTEGQRSWTTTAPPWWPPALPLEVRLTERDIMRALQ